MYVDKYLQQESDQQLFGHDRRFFRPGLGESLGSASDCLQLL